MHVHGLVVLYLQFDPLNVFVQQTLKQKHTKVISVFIVHPFKILEIIPERLTFRHEAKRKSIYEKLTHP